MAGSYNIHTDPGANSKIKSITEVTGCLEATAR